MKDTHKMHFKYRIALFLILILCGCQRSSNLIEFSNALDLNLEKTEILSEEDTIGWFGDGYVLMKVCCLDNSVLNEIKEDGFWHELPLSDNLNTFFYRDYHFNNDLPIPIIEKGYYRFIDRHPQAEDQNDDSKLYDRGSFNFTLAVYDLDDDMLYLCKFNS